MLYHIHHIFILRAQKKVSTYIPLTDSPPTKKEKDDDNSSAKRPARDVALSKSSNAKLAG